jgi:dolichol-phosphate mannosyltransferase
MAEPLISVILPTYNEKGNILDLVSEIKVLLEGRSKEILVVDDNSPDGTAEAVSRRFAGDPEVRVIVRARDRGMAKSIREGLEKSKGRRLVVMGSDFNHLPRYIPFMVDALDHYDGVFGSRFLYGGWMSSVVHHKLSWAFNLFIRGLLGGSITDNLYGYYAIRREAIERCRYGDIFWGFGDYCIRLLYYLEINRVSILQIPMVVGERRAGVGNRAWVRTLVQYLISTIGLTLNKNGMFALWRRWSLPITGVTSPDDRS